jgi:hypothetical protein
MAQYYAYAPCPSGPIEFYSNVAPTNLASNSINFTSGVPAEYLGICYRVSIININTIPAPPPPSPLHNINWISADYTVSPKCDSCEGTKSYELVPCCGGSSLFVNVLTPNTLVSGDVYYVIIFSEGTQVERFECFTVNELTTYDPSYLFIPEGQFSTDADCNDLSCETLCLPCLCTKFKVDPPFILPPPILPTVTLTDCDLNEYEYEIPWDGSWSDSICTRSYKLGPRQEAVTLGECTVSVEDGIVSECPIVYDLVNCQDNEDRFCVTNDLSYELSQNYVLELPDKPGKCWRIEVSTDCTVPVSVLYSTYYSTCETCLNKNAVNYELINCATADVIVYTSTDLSEYVGTIVSLQEYPDDCWFVRLLESQIPSDITVNVVNQFASCEICNSQYYLLEDCDIDNPEPNIVTLTDLSAYITPPGQVVTLNNCPDKCWIVSETDLTVGAQTVHVIANHLSCEDCIVPPTPVVPDPPVYKSIRPGYNTPACTPAQYERIVCNFSEGVYRSVMVEAYGITPCCGEDDMRWEIKNEIIKLKAIKDPDYNCTGAINCDCTTSTAGLSQQNCQAPN